MIEPVVYRPTDLFAGPGLCKPMASHKESRQKANRMFFDECDPGSYSGTFLKAFFKGKVFNMAAFFF